MNPASSEHWRNPGVNCTTPFPAFVPNGVGSNSHSLPPPPTPAYPMHHDQRQLPPATAAERHNPTIADLVGGASSHSQYNTAPPPSTSQQLRRDVEMREDPGSRAYAMQEMDRLRRIQELERQQREQAALHQRNASSLPIHQPVASKVQTTLQGPNGLLNSDVNTQMNGLSTPANQAAFTSQSGLAGFTPQPSGPQSAPQPYLVGPSSLSGQVPVQLAHSQQPILNDALSYLDQVKVRFSDHPDVYNKFLDIMKDFKSQAIDTPGVINRVSELFNGHPALIQGFNTFLPPGYRIECGTDENPDAIRVTTPSGTMTQSLQPRNRNFDTLPPQHGFARQDTIESARSWGQSPSMGANRLPGQYDQDPSMAQDQRNLTTMTSAANATLNNMRVPGGSSPLSAQAALGRSGPVEFNHAISYVNKIKNRFSSEPEIYKNFLEILQTYQRESKPIQDVYQQVTKLFDRAPDLLDDFKQFLPESTATAKQQAAIREVEAQLSAVRAEPSYAVGLPQAQTPRPTAKMPPLGQFDPPSTVKENKKRKMPGAVPAMPAAIATQESKGRSESTLDARKRQKFEARAAKNADVQLPQPVGVTEASLTPALPVPLPPVPTANSSQEELALFDRIKKAINNRGSYSEFLKLLNLYTQDIIDKYVLVDRVQSFIGNNTELIVYFRGFIGIEEHDELIEARRRPETGRVNLAQCRAYGPSYRHLPKADTQKPCKGRDSMCYEVLNDTWASHPTWASEDSGFVAHKKNQYEEALHRIEEERHDYDFHIECCQRVIQLLEPIVGQIKVMSDAERASFTIQEGLGGPSTAIPKRILAKIYGREQGQNVLKEMYNSPAVVMPIVLNRLKQKLEEWKQTQREWEKVWRDQINRQFWKSLDHQGIAQKVLDKRSFNQKTLQAEINAKWQEQRAQRERGMRPPRYQFKYEFADNAVLADATQLILAHMRRLSLEEDGKREIMKKWLVQSVVVFFGLDREVFEKQLEGAALLSGVETPDDVEDEAESDSQSNGVSRRKRMTGNWLRKTALERRNLKDDSIVPTSKESTPVPDGMATDSEMELVAEKESENTSKNEVSLDESAKPWLELDISKEKPTLRPPVMDELYTHSTFNFYCNNNLYSFFRLLQQLYARLLSIKESEASVKHAVERWLGQPGVLPRKPAIGLYMLDKEPSDFFSDTSDDANYYSQVLALAHKVIVQSASLPLMNGNGNGSGNGVSANASNPHTISAKANLEELLRRFYNKTGWQLYSVDRHVSNIFNLIRTINEVGKDKSLDIYNEFVRDRERSETSRKLELAYRKKVEKITRPTGSEVYRISWVPAEKTAYIRLVPSEDLTFDGDKLTEEAKWQYYTANYIMGDTTEGVDPNKLQRVLLERSKPLMDPDPRRSYLEYVGSMDHVDNTKAWIDMETYKIEFEGGWSFERRNADAGYKVKDVEDARQRSRDDIRKSEAFRTKFLNPGAQALGGLRITDETLEGVGARIEAWKYGLEHGFHNLRRE